jgi:hypothetical protein
MKVILPVFRLDQVILDNVAAALQEGDLNACIEWADRMFDMVPKGPYHIVRDLDFTTCPQDTAKKFDEWILAQEAVRPFGSAYTETNGFGINPDQWHFQWFAYEAEVSGDDFDYLGEGYISEDNDGVILTGMETLQAVYQKRGIRNEEFARAICDCHVIFKFMRFIQGVSGKMRQFRHPLVVSSHGWDTFLTLKPRNGKSVEQVAPSDGDKPSK